MISAVMCVRNEDGQLADCLAGLGFADEIVIVLDRSTDGSKAIAERHGAKIVEGAFEREGERRHAGIDAARGPWIFEIDADERVTPELAAEIVRTQARNAAARKSHTKATRKKLREMGIKLTQLRRCVWGRT